MSVIVLIAEQRDIQRLGLQTILCSDERVSLVGEARTPEELQMQLSLTSFDYVFVSQEMLTTVTIVATLPQGRFVVLAPKLDVHIFQLAYWRGACGYLLEATSADLLLMTLSQAGGSFLIEPALTPELIAHFMHQTRRPLFTPREREIVGMLCRGTERSALPACLNIDRGTVNVHIKNILRKLQSPSL
ncbi:MAG TPA: LuxR C-terminal-related transcriptional regulator [Ktedonobacteraceae bacterium]|jgi:two-component system NarL family response regulator|nr:LuxR C-terminal-related transcriptional regulator [Ktedonobacteraceae bacterium]